jgi:hypothetical protein
MLGLVTRRSAASHSGAEQHQPVVPGEVLPVEGQKGKPALSGWEATCAKRLQRLGAALEPSCLLLPLDLLVQPTAYPGSHQTWPRRAR